MNSFAKLIRIGLACQRVIEDPEVDGAVNVGDNVRANVIGLALIGAVGIEKAVCLFQQVRENPFPSGQPLKDILAAIRISLCACSKLAFANHAYPASWICEIMDRFEPIAEMIAVSAAAEYN
ncbi:hypothetical protein KKG36_01730 [Patescibacteria group bacterium]|nr:hypothetical protein [Patescibacteria group bacterium]